MDEQAHAILARRDLALLFDAIPEEIRVSLPVAKATVSQILAMLAGFGWVELPADFDPASPMVRFVVTAAGREVIFEKLH